MGLWAQSCLTVPALLCLTLPGATFSAILLAPPNSCADRTAPPARRGRCAAAERLSPVRGGSRSFLGSREQVPAVSPGPLGVSAGSMDWPAGLPLTFEDVAIYFSEQEWQNLQTWQKELYKNVMRTNYETLVSLDGRLPKPELISWIECGREPFSCWEAKQKPGRQETVKSGEIISHFQFDPLQIQHSFGLVLGEREAVSFRHDQGISLEVPSLQSTQHSCPVYEENNPKKNHLVTHQKGHSRKPSRGVRKVRQAQQQRNVTGTQRHFACPDCGRGFRQKQHLRRHLNAHTKNPSRCPKCKLCFYHGQTRVSCYFKYSSLQKCDKNFFPKDSRNAHQRQQSAGRPASWREDTTMHSGQKPGPSLDGADCLRRENNLEALQCSGSQGGDRPFVGVESSNSVSSGSKLASLCRAHAGEKPFLCPEYNKRLCLRGRRSVQQCVHSGQGPFTSKKCDPGLTKHCRLMEHSETHSGEKSCWCVESSGSPCQRGQLLLQQAGEKPFSCSECGRTFSHPCKLREHLRVHNGERPFQCSECHKSFRLKGVLKTHQRIHSKERPFSCAECGKGFTRQSNLTDHLRVHSGERPFQCPECDRSFRLKAQLLIHQRLHTGERPYQCPECGKSYRMRAVMKAHQLLHGGQMPFSCECGKGFAKQSKLVEHMRMHTGEKPFHCPTCDKSFRLKTQLLSHQGLHTGQRPFHCPECDKNFREKSHMVRHQRIHRPERPFVCGDCGKGFIYKSKLAGHIRVHRKSCPVPPEPKPKADIKKRLSQLFAMIEADWS